jgi:hypothetical protein
MVFALDQIRLLCDYAGALLWSHKRRTKTMETETADKYLNIFPSALLAAVARGEVDLNHWAGVVLAGRGLDQDARWVGFPEAARLQDQRSQA